jgi:cyclophilin family peptidyl-prolyl cis-trans isomerase/HEAT repeat protein
MRNRPGRGARTLYRLTLVLLLGPSVSSAQQTFWYQDARGAALLKAEDERGAGPAGIEPILSGLRDDALRPYAIRALGRLERPELIQHVVPFLADPAVAASAADAIAQALRGVSPPASRTARERSLVDSAFRSLRDRARASADPIARGAMARSLGRLPYEDPRQARDAETVLVSFLPAAAGREWTPTMEGVAHGLYSLARARRTIGDTGLGALDWLRRTAVIDRDSTTRVLRRLAWFALTAAGGADAPRIRTALGDADAQIRRLAVAAVPNVADTSVRREILGRAFRDSEPMVRLEWVRVFRQLLAAGGCGPLLAAAGDAHPQVRLAAIDALGGPCPERDSVIAVLRTEIDRGPAGVSPRSRSRFSWHGRAHALAALARVDGAVAKPLLARDARHPVWQVRMYVARGAAAARDSAVLTALAFDDVGSVREVAIQGLSGIVGHVADRVYMRALSSPDYHVVLAAARALRNAPMADSVLPAVMQSLTRLTRLGEQTSRDPRMELLARVDEMGDRRVVPQLTELLDDVDPAVAADARRIVQRLEPSMATTTPARAVRREISLATGPVMVRVTMAASSGGGSFDLELDPARAPMTVGRVLHLIGTRYYDGLTWHRVAPNFVVQGGSPGMNEYVGDGPFLRDELDLAHHLRGTLGISTRGRDTGDSQWFINMVDNFRLDHDYTVFARVIRGMAVVDDIIEGDVIESVRVIR